MLKTKGRTVYKVQIACIVGNRKEWRDAPSLPAYETENAARLAMIARFPHHLDHCRIKAAWPKLARLPNRLKGWIVLDQEGTPLWSQYFWTKRGAIKAWRKCGRS